MAGYKDFFINRVLDALEKEGRRILQECVDEREYQHDTYNLFDSYGYGIYVDGALKRKGFLSASRTAEKPKKWYENKDVWGRGQIEYFLNQEYQAGKSIEMVIVAAMPYAEVLENASGGQTRKYRVISMSYDKLKSLQAQIPNSSVSTIIRSKKHN